MGKLKVLGAKEVLKILKDNGFIEKSQKGSHIKLINSKGNIVIVPVHIKDIPIGTLRSIIRQSKLSKELFSS